MSKKYTRDNYVKYLNELSPDFDSPEWIIGGKDRDIGTQNYGVMLRKHDKIAFEVGYREWCNKN